MAYKRKRAPTKSKKSYVSRAKRARTGLHTRWAVRQQNNALNSRVNTLYRMIETKETTITNASNSALDHNELTLLSNPFTINQGTSDPMSGTGTRIGDKISVKGCLFTGMIECALNRPKVFIRIMLVKAAKSDDPTTSALFKGDSGNKMIDQVNTDRYTLVYNKVFTVEASNAPTAVTVNIDGSVATGNPGGIGTRMFKCWVPGTKFGKGGNVQYEDGNTSQLKFFNYRWCILAYDWYGTPELVTTVARVNSAYTKLYFKDA